MLTRVKLLPGAVPLDLVKAVVFHAPPEDREAIQKYRSASVIIKQALARPIGGDANESDNAYSWRRAVEHAVGRVTIRNAAGLLKRQLEEGRLVAVANLAPLRDDSALIRVPKEAWRGQITFAESKLSVEGATYINVRVVDPEFVTLAEDEAAADGPPVKRQGPAAAAPARKRPGAKGVQAACFAIFDGLAESTELQQATSAKRRWQLVMSSTDHIREPADLARFQSKPPSEKTVERHYQAWLKRPRAKGS
jgi:hypothetical protein